MGILSSSTSINRYRVATKLDATVHETVYQALQQYAFPKAEDDTSEMAVGWTSFDKPFTPDFEGRSFVFGAYMVFSLRIDKKTVPAKLIHKHYATESARRLADSGHTFLSRGEKKAIKDHVVNVLTLRIPATPNLYDLIWNNETAELWFFSNLKSANEEFETLFYKSYKLHLIRLFPYTIADLAADLPPAQKDFLHKLSPTDFTE